MKYNKEIQKSDGRILTAGGPRDMQRRARAQMDEIDDLKDQIELLKRELYSIPKNIQQPLPIQQTSSADFSKEQLEEEINKATEELSLELESKYQSEIDNMKEVVKSRDVELEKVRERMRTLKDEYLIRERELGQELKALKLELSNKENEQKAVISILEEKHSKVVDDLNSKLDKKDSTISDLTNKIADISSRPVNIVSSGAVPEETEDPDRPSIDNVFIDPSKNKDESKIESHVINKEAKTNKPKVSSDVSKLKNLMGGKIPKI